jgi:hypothetical protein
MIVAYSWKGTSSTSVEYIRPAVILPSDALLLAAPGNLPSGVQIIIIPPTSVGSTPENLG